MNQSLLNLTKYFDKKQLRNSAILIGVVIFFFFVFFTPSLNTANMLSEKSIQVKNDVIRSRHKINDFPNLLDQRDALSCTVTEYEKKMIFDGDKTNFIGEISDLARKQNVAITSLRPLSASDEISDEIQGIYKALSYELLLESGYHEFGAFLNQVELMDVFVKIDSFNLDHTDGKNKKLNIKLIVSTYVRV